MKKYKLLLVFVSFIIFGCKNCPMDREYQLPKYVNDGLKVGTLTDVNIDTVLISKGLNRINCGSFGEVHSMVIYKDNLLVLEEYFQGHKFKWDAPNYYGALVNWNMDMPHSMMSCTKSFTSACIGIAIDKGFIKDVHQSIFDYLPNYQQFRTDNREYITLEHLITMTSGLAWDEWSALHGTSANDIDRLYFECEDPIICVLEKNWWAVPGEKFTYNGGGMVILAEIIKNATNMNIYEFSMKYLFKPLSIDTVQWGQFENSMYDSAGMLFLTPRDMLKLGITYLNKGEWNGKRIISDDWVKNSAKPFNNNIGINIPGEDSGKNGYGYTWWTSQFSHNGSEINMFRAGGWGGQEIMVFPELDMVVVFTGGNYDSSTSLFKLLEKFILPAIK
jgi:CubicO group peptidase (beta-lactamase class C family)